MAQYDTVALATLKKRLINAYEKELLPIVYTTFIGDGAAALTTQFSVVVDILSERHKFEGKIKPILRALQFIGNQPPSGSSGGSAYYEQDGALNSGFADLLNLPDLEYLNTNYRHLNYQPLRDLVVSMQDAAGNFFKGKHAELLEEYGKRNQAGANMLAAHISNGKIDTTTAALLRRSVWEVLHNLQLLLDNFVKTFIPEIPVFERLNETEAYEWSYNLNRATRKFTVKTRKVGASGKDDTIRTDIVVDVTGTRTINLVSPDVTTTACVGPANAAYYRDNLDAHSRINPDGTVATGTITTIVGQELHGYDYAAVTLTVLGANERTSDPKQPWAAKKDFANTGIKVRMMSRDGGNLPPPRLSHDKVWPGAEQPLLTTSDLIAASLFRFNDQPAYKQVRDHAIARALGVHPNALPVDATSEDQLRRYGEDIQKHEAGQLTFTELEEKFAVSRQFVEVPSANPKEAEAAANAEFPEVYRDGATRYNSRYAYLTTEYLKDHPSNAATMKEEKRGYTVFASAPKTTVAMLYQHLLTGTLELVTGDSKNIAHDGSHLLMYDTDAGKSHLICSPPLIDNKPSAFLLSYAEALKKDEHGEFVCTKQRKLCLEDGTPIPFYVYGNQLNGTTFKDDTGEISTRNKQACDVATLFANFMGNKAALSASISIDAWLLANNVPNPGQAWLKIITRAAKPSQEVFSANVEKAGPRVQNMRGLEIFLRLIRSERVANEWNVAASEASTAARRNALMEKWSSGNDAQKQIAKEYFKEIYSLPALAPKSLDQHWNEDVELPLGPVRTAYDQTLQQFL